MDDSEINALADVCAVNEATLAKLVGLVMAEVIALAPASKARLKTKLAEVAMHPDELNRELTTQIVKQVARSAGIRIPAL